MRASFARVNVVRTFTVHLRLLLLDLGPGLLSRGPEYMPTMGPIDSKMVFVVVDAHSKWTEAVLTTFSTSWATIV